MKKFIKWCLILAGVLLAVGIVLHSAGEAMGGRVESDNSFVRRWSSVTDRWGNFPFLGEYIGNEQWMDTGELTDIIAVDVDMAYGDIIVEPGEKFSAYLAWNLRGYWVNYQVEDGVLTISDENWRGGFKGLSKPKCEVIIKVPNEAALARLNLATDFGDVEVDASLIVDEAQLSTDLGDVKCVGLLFDELKAETDLGDVELTLPWQRSHYCWELETELGEITVDGKKQGGSMNSIIQGGEGGFFVEAHSSLGDVSLDFAS